MASIEICGSGWKNKINAVVTPPTINIEASRALAVNGFLLWFELVDLLGELWGSISSIGELIRIIIDWWNFFCWLEKWLDIVVDRHLPLVRWDSFCGVELVDFWLHQICLLNISHLTIEKGYNIGISNHFCHQNQSFKRLLLQIY